MRKGVKGFAKKRKLHLKKENLAEDKIIKSLEKKLKINKKSSKYVPKSFVCDGLDYILDVCNEETRKIAAESEKRLLLPTEDELDDLDSDYNEADKVKPIRKKTKTEKKKTCLINQKNSAMQSDSESDFESDDNEDIHNNEDNKISKSAKKNSQSRDNNIKKHKKDIVNKKKNVEHTQHSSNSKSKKDAVLAKKRKISVDDSSRNQISSESCSEKTDSDFSEDESHSDCDQNSLNSDKKSDIEKDENLWEDIYGRKRNKDGTLVTENKQKYITPALRLQELKENSEKNEKWLSLKRQIKGILNRLAESNMHAIISQFDELYMSNSRNDMNEMISNLMLESIVAPALTPERLVTEHMMCVAILHANVGTQVGAHFTMALIKKFNEMIPESQVVENKELDNLVLMLAYLYNFKVFASQLMYQILEKLIDKFTEKEIEVILLILKTAGLRMRKDDPLALKELILNLQQKATAVKSSNSRITFMLDVLLAIKNNNMNKIPQYDQSHFEHLKKVIKTLIRKGNTISQLNLSLEDLLNADERGKWWIIGSAWSGKSVPNTSSTKTNDDGPVYSQKILDLARAQRMNTNTRKNIFCILMTAEDYLDAFEKLHHLGLKDRQEREIIYVILNCCLQEKKFNPYYAVLLQKFCEYDRKYQMTIQYSLWDKLKMLNTYSNQQVINMAKMMSHLFIQKALPLSILKVIQLGELDAPTMKLFRKIMLDILLHESTETCLQVFEKIAISAKLHQFREGLRLFINYFLKKNIKKEKISEKQMQFLENRIELVNKILITATSKISF